MRTSTSRSAIIIRDGSNLRAILLILLRTLGCAVVLMSWTATAQQNTRALMPWIDVHVHPFSGRGSYDFAGSVNKAVAVMEQAGIAKMVLLPPPQPSSSKSPYDYDSFLAAVKAHGSHLAFLGGGGSLNVMIQGAGGEAVGDRAKRSFEQKATEILQAGAVGFGEITAHHLSLFPTHPYESVPADSPLLLFLTDIAARNDVVIDFHFDPVANDQQAPDWSAPPNPPQFHPNLAAFERLLEHNRSAKIVWAHLGSDQLGQWTVALSRRLLDKNPNLYMSLRLSAPGRAPRNNPLTRSGTLKPQSLELLTDFPDRFVFGSDWFFASAGTTHGAGAVIAERQEPRRDRTLARSNRLLAALPATVARKIAFENAMRLYKLKD